MRIPLHLLTGFLGSGKTALLRGLLERSAARIAVLVNEVGELGLDHHLLERVDEDVLMLPGGCVCCEVRGEVYAALERVVALAPGHIVLETSGIADPAPVLHGIASDPRLRAALRLGGVTAVVDCLRAQELIATQPEVRRQLDFADRVVLSKADLAPHRLDDVRAWLEREVPGREVRVAVRGDVDPVWLLEDAGFARPEAGNAGAGARGWLRQPPPHADHGATDHGAFSTHALRHDEPVDVDAVQLWLRLVTQLDGPRLLRIKGIVRCAATGACYALQSAGPAVSPPQRLGVVPPGLRGAEIVVIERGMPASAMTQLLAALESAVRCQARFNSQP